MLPESPPTPATLAQTESNWKLQIMIKYEFHRLQILREQNLDGIKLQKYQKDFEGEDMAIKSVFRLHLNF